MVYCLHCICLLFISYLVLLLQVLRRYHKFAGCRRSRRRGQAALSGHPVEETHNLLVAKVGPIGAKFNRMMFLPVEGVEGLHEVSLGDGGLLAEHRRAEELAVALVGTVLLGQLEGRRMSFIADKL